MKNANKKVKFEDQLSDSRVDLRKKKKAPGSQKVYNNQVAKDNDKNH